MSGKDWQAQAWAALEQVQAHWQGAVGGRPVFDSLGRSVHGGWSRVQGYWEGNASRVARVRSALNQSGPVAQGLIAKRLQGIDLSLIWDILLDACKEIALYYGGSVVAGAVLGGIVGALAGGAGAVPGAMAGAVAGSQVGLWVLALLGLKSLAEFMVDALPEAMRLYETGFRLAWGSPPQPSRGGPASSQPQAVDTQQAAVAFGHGHVIVITAMLMGLVAYLTRGRGDKAALLQEIRQSPRLGPKVAAWVEANEKKLLNHPHLNPNARTGRAEGPTRGHSAAQSPSQLSGRASSRNAPEPSSAASPAAPAQPKSIKNASTAEKGVFGEAKADQHMLDQGFTKMNGAPVKVGDAPLGKGIDGVWRNANPPPDYVITEAKYGSSQLSTLKDGTKQMSDEWIDGRLEKAVGPREAIKIQDAMAEGRVEKRLLRVDEHGNVSTVVLTD